MHIRGSFIEVSLPYGQAVYGRAPTKTSSLNIPPFYFPLFWYHTPLLLTRHLSGPLFFRLKMHDGNADGDVAFSSFICGNTTTQAKQVL